GVALGRADGSRVGAVGGVVDLARRGRHDQRIAGRDRSAVLAEAGGRDGGVQAGAAKLAEHDVAALGEVGVENVIDGGRPGAVAGEGRLVVVVDAVDVVAPAGRLGGHGAVDFVDQGRPASLA